MEKTGKLLSGKLPGTAWQAEPKRRSPPWGLVEIGVCVLAYVGLTLALIAGAAFLGLMDSQPSRLNSRLAISAIAHITIAGLIMGLVKRRAGCLDALGFRPLPARLFYLPVSGVGGAFLVMLIYTWTADKLGWEIFTPESNAPAHVFDTVPSAVLFGVLALIIAPFTEEVMIRGFLFGGLRRWLSVGAAAVVSGAFFGLVHQDPGLIIPIGIIGALLAVIYSLTGSIYASMVMHFLFNAISFLAALVMTLH